MPTTTVTPSSLIAELTNKQNSHQARILQRFFKTNPGEYGAGDMFLGLKVPQVRHIAQRYYSLTLKDMVVLLHNPYHEIRLAAAIILVQQYQRAIESAKSTYFQFYVDHLDRFNNWDLIDVSAPKILGEHVLHQSQQRQMLKKLAKHRDLWHQRAAIVATLTLIKAGELQMTLQLAELLLTHPHDLIHKATGWMLRELGKKDQNLLVAFLWDHYAALPRTTLRYAIERLNPALRRSLLLAKTKKLQD